MRCTRERARIPPSRATWHSRGSSRQVDWVTACEALTLDGLQFDGSCLALLAGIGRGSQRSPTPLRDSPDPLGGQGVKESAAARNWDPFSGCRRLV